MKAILGLLLTPIFIFRYSDRNFHRLSSLGVSSICVKRRNELNMKPAAVIHMLSPRNFKIGSYTRSPHVGGLATVSRHPVVVHAGRGEGLAYIYICNIYIYTPHIHICYHIECVQVHTNTMH